jgi:hypothetical protein
MMHASPPAGRSSVLLVGGGGVVPTWPSSALKGGGGQTKQGVATSALCECGSGAPRTQALGSALCAGSAARLAVAPAGPPGRPARAGVLGILAERWGFLASGVTRGEIELLRPCGPALLSFNKK